MYNDPYTDYIRSKMDPKTRGLSNRDLDNVRDEVIEGLKEDAKDDIREDIHTETATEAARILDKRRMEAPEWVEHFPPFIKILTERLKQGHIDYGNKSFSRDPLALIEEVQEELLDIVGWSFITYVRIAKIKSEIRTTIGGLHGELGDILGRYTEGRSEREQGPEPQVRGSTGGQTSEIEVDGL